MRVMGILAILIVTLFIISLSFMVIGNNQNPLSESHGSETSATDHQTSDAIADGMIKGNFVQGFPTQQEYQLMYMREQLKNQGSETQLTYQQQLEQARMEYKSLMLQQKQLHERGLLHDKNKHEEVVLKQKLQKEYMLKQQDSSLLNQEKIYEAEMADRLIAFETKKQLLDQQNQQALALQKNTTFEQSLITYVVVVGSAILMLSFSYYIVSSHTARKEHELVRLEQEHIYSLKQQESMQETRIKVLESISDLPEKDKKEIIVGLVGLNRSFEELENKVVEEPPIEIQLTELTPPQMKVTNDKNNT